MRGRAETDLPSCLSHVGLGRSRQARPGGSLTVCPAIHFALCPLFLSLCMRTDPTQPKERRGFLPSRKEYSLGLGQLPLGQGLHGPFQPLVWG